MMKSCKEAATIRMFVMKLFMLRGEVVVGLWKVSIRSSISPQCHHSQFHHFHPSSMLERSCSELGEANEKSCGMGYGFSSLLWYSLWRDSFREMVFLMIKLFSLRDLATPAGKGCPEEFCRKPRRGKVFKLDYSLRELGFPDYTHAHPTCILWERRRQAAERLRRGLK